MRVIWKFKLSGAASEFDAPAGARCVKAIIQPNGEPVVYLLCDREAASARHAVALFATAQSIPEDAGDYVDTLSFAVAKRPPVVMHIFHRQLSVSVAGAVRRALS